MIFLPGRTSMMELLSQANVSFLHTPLEIIRQPLVQKGNLCGIERENQPEMMQQWELPLLGIHLFLATDLFLYPLKISENLWLCNFQGVQKGNIGLYWLNSGSDLYLMGILPFHSTGVFLYPLSDIYTLRDLVPFLQFK